MVSLMLVNEQRERRIAGSICVRWADISIFGICQDLK
jgi:hypothetical protein